MSHLKLQRDPVDDDFAAAFTGLVDGDLHYRVRVPANVLHPTAGEYVMVGSARPGVAHCQTVLVLGG